MHRFSSLFSKRQDLRKKKLFVATEKLVLFEFVFPRSNALQQSDIKNDYVSSGWLDAIQHSGKVVKGTVVAHWNQDIPRPTAHGLRSDLFTVTKMELV